MKTIGEKPYFTELRRTYNMGYRTKLYTKRMPNLHSNLARFNINIF